MQCADIVVPFVIVAALVAFILLITCAAEGKCRPRQLTLDAAGKNRLAGFIIVVASALAVGVLKLCCPEDNALIDGLVTFVTGFGSAVAAVFITHGFPDFRGSGPKTDGDQHTTPNPS